MREPLRTRVSLFTRAQHSAHAREYFRDARTSAQAKETFRACVTFYVRTGAFSHITILPTRGFFRASANFYVRAGVFSRFRKLLRKLRSLLANEGSSSPARGSFAHARAPAQARESFRPCANFCASAEVFRRVRHSAHAREFFRDA